MQAAREAHIAVSLTAGTPELADWAELQRCNLQGVCTLLLLLRWRMHTQPHQYTNPEQSFGSDTGSRRQNPTGPWHPWTKVNVSLETGKNPNLQNSVWMWPYGVLGAKRCFGNGICTNTFPKTTPIWWWPLLLSQLSQCTRMKKIMSRVSSRIREKRWLLSVPTMTRTHTTAIVHCNIDTHNKNKVACVQSWGF